MRTGHIPGPGAPDGLVGSSSAFVHACHMYVQCALYKCLEISPTGTNCFFNAIYIYIYMYIYIFFFNKTLKPINNMI